MVRPSDWLELAAGLIIVVNLAVYWIHQNPNPGPVRASLEAGLMLLVWSTVLRSRGRQE